MATFLSILIIIVSVLLVLIILIQNPKGGGIASNFMSSSSQFIGAKQQVELVEQVTWGFVGALVVLSIAFAALVGTGMKTEVKESIVGKSEMPMPGTSAPTTMPAQQQAPAPTPAPAPKK